MAAGTVIETHPLPSGPVESRRKAIADRVLQLLEQGNVEKLMILRTGILVDRASHTVPDDSPLDWFAASRNAPLRELHETFSTLYEGLFLACSKLGQNTKPVRLLSASATSLEKLLGFDFLDPDKQPSGSLFGIPVSLVRQLPESRLILCGLAGAEGFEQVSKSIVFDIHHLLK